MLKKTQQKELKLNEALEEIESLKKQIMCYIEAIKNLNEVE